TLEILVAVDATVLALGDLAADGLAVIDLRPVGAEIEPAVVWILRDNAARGTDIARGVFLVMLRHREFQHVDGVTFQHVLQDRPVLDEARRQRLQVCHAPVIALHDVDLAFLLERQAEGERDALDRREVAVERAEALGIAWHLVEQDRRCGAVRLLGQHLRDAAHLGVPMGAVDAKKLAHGLDAVEPFAQAAIADAGFPGGVGEGHPALLVRQKAPDCIRSGWRLSPFRIATSARRPAIPTAPARVWRGSKGAATTTRGSGPTLSWCAAGSG